MFNFSLGELAVVCLVAFIFIKPKDLPEIAYFCGKIFYRIKKFFRDARRQFKEIEKEIGFDEIRQELDRGISEAKIKLDEDENEKTVIVDIYGNEHVVDNISGIRPDMKEEEIKKEIEYLNKANSQATSPKNSDESKSTEN